ncbi:uncharacterized protein TM35_000024580 [Trypanosoma theileri]|uniref:Uncharacterized protein n=1 Tax=Trypanosoma theileri TaxID=67003 RepID=A0A1X0P881_9TRYP|nr:uncharacterized protein TM35_000024580 [Trypanosoma theileri]ORC93132.1 hypothetical protein TM35_000024580 [Trypanosoma theileri]
MSEFKHGFSSFIDHYILLLAARFNAPLDAVTLCSNNTNNNNNNNNNNNTNDESNYNNNPMELWENVARCVQDVLAHPQTPAERRELAHIDVSLFTAEVCRDRALYFRWRLQQQTPEAPTAPQLTKTDGKIKKNHGVRPSGFDITRDSIKDEVEAIYAAVRASLPSTLGIQKRGSSTTEEGKVAHMNYNGNSNAIMDGYEEESDVDDSEVEVVEFAMRTEQEESRDRVIAEARDALLTKIQKLQAEFYSEHRRWVDVPYDMDITPAAIAAATTTSSSSVVDGVGKACNMDYHIEATLQENTTDEEFPHMLSKSAMREALDTATPTKASSLKNATTPTSKVAEAAISSPMDFIEVLKRSVHVKRPPRPSQMREEDYKVEYGDILLSQPNGNDFDAAAELAVYRKAAEISGLHPPAAEVDKPQRQEQGLGLRSVNAVAAMESVPQRSRGNRWRVVEYDNDSDQESDVMD